MSLVLESRRWLASARLGASSFFSDGPPILGDLALRVLRVVVLLSLLRTLFAGRGSLSGLPLGAVLTYTFVAEVFAEQLRPRTVLNTSFWDGSLLTRLLQPMGLRSHLASDMVGRWLPPLMCFSLPLFLVAPALGVLPWPAGPGAGASFVVSLAVAGALGLSMDLMAGAITVRLGENPWFINDLRNALEVVLSGSLLPLALYPWNLGGVFEWLPFASVASAPLRIYTGTGDPLLLLVRQLGWLAILWPLGWRFWQSSRERFVGYGG